MERFSDVAIAIINVLHTERLEYNSEYLPLINAAMKLEEYEDAIEEGRLVWTTKCKQCHFFNTEGYEEFNLEHPEFPVGYCEFWKNIMHVNASCSSGRLREEQSNG